jgi:hypothetical protein
MTGTIDSQNIKNPMLDSKILLRYWIAQHAATGDKYAIHFAQLLLEGSSSFCMALETTHAGGISVQKQRSSTDGVSLSGSDLGSTEAYLVLDPIGVMWTTHRLRHSEHSIRIDVDKYLNMDAQFLLP